MRQLRKIAILVGLVVTALSAGPAFAHNLILEAYAVGSDIEGEAFFSDGVFVANTPIEIFDADGNKLGEAMTDENGSFSYTPTSAIEHHLHLDAGAGHVANVVIPAADLGGAGAAAPADAAPGTAATPAAGPVAAPAAGGVPSADVVARIDQLVTREIVPLQTQLDQFQERSHMMDIIAAIGLLVGALGIVFFFAGARIVEGLKPARGSARSTIGAAARVTAGE